MINKDSIKAHMTVVGSDDVQLGRVDHIEGEKAVKLAKDGSGQHHYIPIDWIRSVDDKVHLDRPGSQAMGAWKDRVSMI